MRTYWLLDQHGAKGPTALVETDGSMHVIDVRRFGPDVSELDAQQAVWDQVIGRLAPTLKPFVEAASLDEEGVAPHPKLRRGSGVGGPKSRRGAADPRGKTGSRGRTAGGPSYRRSRGDR